MGSFSGRAPFLTALGPKARSHLATPRTEPPRASARNGDLGSPVDKTQCSVDRQDQAALNLREKVEPSAPTPHDPSLNLQAGSVPGLKERGRIAGGIELERCPVRVRSREKHPVRGPRQSAESRQVTRGDTIQGIKERAGGEAYVEAIFADCRGCRLLGRENRGKENSLGGHKKKLEVLANVGPRYGGTLMVR
jgi:hypothetical protein